MAEDGGRVHTVDDVQIPELDVLVHGADCCEIALFRVLVGSDVEPLDAEGDGRKHNIVMDVEVGVCLVLVYIYL